MIPVLRGVNLEKLEYLGENKTQNENILTHYSVAKADSNYEKTDIILRGTSEKLEYLSENETKNENILTHWSLAQAGSNDEKN